MLIGWKIKMVLFIQKEWKRVLGPANVEVSRIVVVPLEDGLGKHRMR